MAIGPVNNAALLGVQRGMDGIRSSAANIASAPQFDSQAQATSSKPSLERSLVEMHTYSNYTKASVKALQTEDATIGYLLDELA